MPTSIASEGPGRTLSAHTFICKIWYSLLQITNPAPGGFASTDWYMFPNTSSLGRRDCFVASEDFVFALVHVCFKLYCTQDVYCSVVIIG